MSKKGAGWIDIISERKNAGHDKLEDPNNPEWTVYIARSHVTDHETGTESRGLVKIGRGKYMNNIQRGRNQDGSDFRVYARLILEKDSETRQLEKYIEHAYKHRSAVGPQSTQTELYNLTDDEIKSLVSDLLVYSKQFNINVLSTKIYI
jgi:hypothetical protein